MEKGITSTGRQENAHPWIFYVVGVPNENGSGAGMMLICPKGHKIHYALRFRFPPSNNQAEHEALIAGLCLARELQVHNLKVYSDS